MTTRIPLLGEVTCHRAIVPQLRGAMRELRAAGLGHLIESFNGCFVPRFISRDPTAMLSHHSWGIAFDLNLVGNYYGDRRTRIPGWSTPWRGGGSCGAGFRRSGREPLRVPPLAGDGLASVGAGRYDWIASPSGDTTYHTSPTPWPLTSSAVASDAK